MERKDSMRLCPWVGKGESGGKSKLQGYRYWLWSSGKAVLELGPQGKHRWRLMPIDHVLLKRSESDELLDHLVPLTWKVRRYSRF